MSSMDAVTGVPDVVWGALISGILLLTAKALDIRSARQDRDDRRQEREGEADRRADEDRRRTRETDAERVARDKERDADLARWQMEMQERESDREHQRAVATAMRRMEAHRDLLAHGDQLMTECAVHYSSHRRVHTVAPLPEGAVPQMERDAPATGLFHATERDLLGVQLLASAEAYHPAMSYQSALGDLFVGLSEVYPVTSFTYPGAGDALQKVLTARISYLRSAIADRELPR